MRRIHIFYLLFTLQHPRSWFAPAWIAGQHFLGRWRPSFFHTFAQLLLTVRCFHSQSLLSNVAFAIGCSYFANYEQTGAGAQWSNWATSPLDDDSYSLCGCIGMLLADSAIYLFLTWYIETVFPGSLNCSMRDFTIQFNFFFSGQYGVPKPWYFPLQPSYWCSSRSKESAVGEQRTAPMYHLESGMFSCVD